MRSVSTTRRFLTMQQTMQELFSDPRRWTQKAYARDKDGFEINPQHKVAESFCVLGAAWHCYGVGTEKYLEVELRMYHYLEEKFGRDTIVGWQDEEERQFSDIQDLVRELNI